MNKILILDNSADLLNTMKYVLERKNYTVKTLNNNNIDNIRHEICEFQPDLLIADVFSDFADKREICKELRKSAENKNLPILVYSTSAALSEHYKNYDADDFLEKPFELNNLLEKINALLQFSKRRNVTKDIF